MTKVMITGGSGFVGAETIKLLQANNIKIFNYDLMLGYDIRDFEQLDKVVFELKPDRILHLAAIARFADADKDNELAFETNVLGTLNVSRVARKYHIPLVYSSTGSVYMPIKLEPPITEEFPAIGNSVYGCTKAMGERYVQKCNPHIILRYAHLYGKEKRMHGLIGGFLDRINRGLAPILMGGKQSNDFTYIKDIARANYLALTASWDRWNNIYNIGTGEELTAEAAGKLVCDIFGYKGKMEHREARTVDPERFLFDCSKAKIMLGFTAEYTFKNGLIDMAESMGYNLINDITKKKRNTTKIPAK